MKNRTTTTKKMKINPWWSLIFWRVVMQRTRKGSFTLFVPVKSCRLKTLITASTVTSVLSTVSGTVQGMNEWLVLIYQDFLFFHCRCGSSVARLCRLCNSPIEIQCDVCGLQETIEESFSSCTSAAESLQDISQLLCEVKHFKIPYITKCGRANFPSAFCS